MDGRRLADGEARDIHMSIATSFCGELSDYDARVMRRTDIAFVS